MVKLHVQTQKNLIKALIPVKPSTLKVPALLDQLDVVNLAKMLLWLSISLTEFAHQECSTAMLILLATAWNASVLV